MSIGRRVAQARRAAGKTQSDIAREALTDVSTISRYERGALTPGVEVLVRIARACGASVEWLATGEGDAPAATGTDG